MIPALTGPVRDVTALVLPPSGTARRESDAPDDRPRRVYDYGRAPACADCGGDCDCVLSDPTLAGAR